MGGCRLTAARCPFTSASSSSVAPLGTAYHLPPRESMSLNSQSPYGSLQHGYHRLTGFSGRSRSSANPFRWCDSSSFATSASGGTMSGSFLRKALPDRAEDRSESQISNLFPQISNLKPQISKTSPLWYCVPPFHPRFGRVTKGKRLYGQARRLTSPDLRILCRMCTVDNNPQDIFFHKLR